MRRPTVLAVSLIVNAAVMVVGPPAAYGAAPQPVDLAGVARPAAGSARLPAYRLVDLGKLGLMAEATSINDSNEVVGWDHQLPPRPGVSFHHQAFLWSPSRTNGALRLLDTLPCPGCAAPASEANDINNRGQIVGFADTPAGARAFLWDNGTVTNLGSLGGPSVATAINKHGQVVGYSTTSTGDVHAFSWTRSTGMRDLSGGMRFSAALDVNDAGRIVGRCGDVPPPPPSTFHPTAACLWKRNGAARRIAGVPGRPAEAVGINTQGDVVGDFQDATGKFVAFLWSGGRLVILTDPAMTTGDRATAINDSRTIAGVSSFDDLWVMRAGERAVLPGCCGPHGHGGASTSALNTAGVVAGRSIVAGDEWLHAVIWCPTDAAAAC